MRGIQCKVGLECWFSGSGERTDAARGWDARGNKQQQEREELGWMEAGSWPPPPSSQGLRVKRGMIASRRTGPSTPVPSWNVFNNQTYDGVAAAAAAAAGGRSTPVSARKLAASLWELQDLSLPGSLGTTTTTTTTTTRWPSSSAKDTSATASPISQADISYRSPASTKYSNELLSKVCM